MKAIEIIHKLRGKYIAKYKCNINNDKDSYIRWLQDEYAELAMKQANEDKETESSCTINSVSRSYSRDDMKQAWYAGLCASDGINDNGYYTGDTDKDSENWLDNEFNCG